MLKLQVIKQYIQKIGLLKLHLANNRSAMIANFNSINTIGILSNPDNEKEIHEIWKIITHLQEFGKQIYPLIYFNKKIEHDICTKNIDCIAFSKINCNWIGKPKKDINLDRFINKEFDILIDLSFSEIYSLQYIFVQSKARLKIMPTSDLSKQFADLMLETSDLQSKSAFVNKLIHYLKIINKDQQ